MVGISAMMPATVRATGESELVATIRSNDPLKSVLALKNSSAQACVVAATATGTVAITQVIQDGRSVTPTPMGVWFEDGLDNRLATQLKTLQPGESIDIPLRATQSGDKVGLQPVTWSSDGGALGLLYVVTADRPVQLELNYSVPIDSPTDTPMCGGVQVSNIDDTSWVGRFVTGLAILSGALVLGLLLWGLKRRGKKPIVAAVCIVVGSAACVGIISRPVYAQVTVPPEVQSNWDNCMATLEENRDITGPILDLINDPSVHIVIDPVDSGGTEAHDPWPDGSFHVDWDINDRHRYQGTGGTVDPCTSMYHELYHVLDMQDGPISRDNCAGSGIEEGEVLATRAQNVLRARLGMPQRTHYDGHVLPLGDCHESPAPPRPVCTCGRSIGEPHLLTFDGHYYDFQAAGEFVLARAKDGSFEVQVRQQQWEDSRWVAVNTAAAVRTARHSIEIMPDGHKLAMILDGKKQPLKTMEFLDGDTLTVIDTTEIDITTKEGAVVTVRSLGNYGVDVSVDPSEGLKGKMEGLLGDYDGEGKNDLKLRDKDTVIQSDFGQLYPAFADSWRITDVSSHFTYESGKNTTSYTNRAFPYERADPKKLVGYTAAEVLCRRKGVTDSASLADCAMDVAIIGRPEFAQSALRHQPAIKDQIGTVTLDGDTVTADIARPGMKARFTFNASVGQRLFVDASNITIPGQCSPLAIIDSDGQNIGSGCIVDGKGIIDTAIIAKNGQYILQVDPSDDTTGKATLKLITSQFVTKTIAIGESTKLTFAKPGDEAEVRFDGIAGQRVYVETFDTTLPGQCGGFGMQMPNGDKVDGCIAGKDGSLQGEGIVLPTNGTYTVFINPAAANTGALSIRVRR